MAPWSDDEAIRVAEPSGLVVLDDDAGVMHAGIDSWALCGASSRPRLDEFGEPVPVRRVE